MVNQDNFEQLIKELDGKATLVAVSKIKPAEDIMKLYELGQHDFGENYVQELLDKAALLPEDIRWHFIGHLQRNKVKFLAPFVSLIHGVDSLRLLKEIDKEGKKISRKIPCLLQIHIATEDSKFGFDEAELLEAMQQASSYEYVQIRGLMGMASFSEDQQQVQNEFRQLKKLYDQYAAAAEWDCLSMGMSGDYQLALAEGSSMVRIGSLLFGAREKKQS